ncbi:MAG: DUF4037 domain-containing protein, partial [Clostridia bacterium]|nr:DUF4037 domain-containing protein [Clostridia bacterium]
MKGLELSEKYYLEYGKKMLETEFSDIEKYLAIGLFGSGSECFGYDDEVSCDHDFEPGFCIFLPDESVIDSNTEFKLARANAKLPNEFMGYKRTPVNPVGGNRYGVIRTADFFRTKVGKEDGMLTDKEWLTIPSFYLAEATNGKIYKDEFGLVTSIRKNLSEMPRDVKLKKIAGNLLLMAQAGQYNYERCLSHGEKAASQLAVNEFVNAAMETLFLLNGKHMPFYKWSFRALKDLEFGKELYGNLESLLFGDK